MKFKRTKAIYHYLAIDYSAAAIAWSLFYIFRKTGLESKKFGVDIPISSMFYDVKFYLALLAVPTFWIIFYAIFGCYKKVYKKSRFEEFAQTLGITFIGSVILFFLVVIDDEVASYIDFRLSFAVLFSTQFIFISSFRLIYLTYLKNKLKTRQVGFNTLLIGHRQKAAELYQELKEDAHGQGYKIIGFLSINAKESDEKNILHQELPYLGRASEAPEIIKEQEVEEVIIATENKDNRHIKEIISILKSEDVNIKITPNMYDIITGMVKMNYVYGTALLNIKAELLPEWQQNIKRIFDILVSLLVLVIGFPFFLLIAIAIKSTSKGPVFYKQERIGIYGRPFYIYKFRSMKTDAEAAGPKLSSDNDPRITKIGLFLRKYRLDEFPQFYNVLKGDMSIVGPRPERQYFIDKIVEKAPHYKHLLRVKPGITSWGQVKYGYAENVDEMVARMKYDILYIENMSIAMDIKILLYTVLTVIRGSGK